MSKNQTELLKVIYESKIYEEILNVINTNRYIKEISISKNRVAVELPNGETAQFVVWDLEHSQHEKLTDQIKTGFAICKSLDDVEKHLKINGFDAVLEDIHAS